MSDITVGDGMDLAGEVVVTPGSILVVAGGGASLGGFLNVTLVHLVDAGGLVEPAAALIGCVEGVTREVGIIIFEPLT